MICQQCGIRPATTKITFIRNGQRQTLNLCSVCAAQMRGGYDDFGGFSLFDEFFSDLLGGLEPGMGFTPSRPRRGVRHIDITEYFSDETKKVIAESIEIAKDYGSKVLNTEHLLLALLNNEVVQEVIKEAKSDPEILKKAVEEELEKKNSMKNKCQNHHPGLSWCLNWLFANRKN